MKTPEQIAYDYDKKFDGVEISKEEKLAQKYNLRAQVPVSEEQEEIMTRVARTLKKKMIGAPFVMNKGAVVRALIELLGKVENRLSDYPGPRNENDLVEMMQDAIKKDDANASAGGEEMTDTKQSDNFIMGKQNATEIFRITHTDTGWHVVVNPERTMTDAAKCFIEAVNNLQRPPLPSATRTNLRQIEKSSQEGCKPNETRATFIVREEHLAKLKALAYWERRLVKDVMAEMIAHCLERYEAHNGEIMPMPKEEK